jgi:inhibitor of the pro-sigma K processing machinery
MEMRLVGEPVLLVGAGVLAVVLLRLLGLHVGMLLRVVLRVVLGGMSLWVLDILLAQFHLELGINLASAAIVGLLGFPGLLLLGGLRMLMH